MSGVLKEPAQLPTMVDNQFNSGPSTSSVGQRLYLPITHESSQQSSPTVSIGNPTPTQNIGVQANVSPSPLYNPLTPSSVTLQGHSCSPCVPFIRRLEFNTNTATTICTTQNEPSTPRTTPKKQTARKSIMLLLRQKVSDPLGRLLFYGKHSVQAFHSQEPRTEGQFQQVL